MTGRPRARSEVPVPKTPLLWYKNRMKSISKRRGWLFALGQFGWALLSGLIGTYLVNFYLPGGIILIFYGEKSVVSA